MNIQLAKDALTGNYKKPNIFLCEVDKTKICKLETTDTKLSAKFNSYSEISFEIGRVYNDLMTGETKVFPYYDKIEALRLILVEGVGYFEIQTAAISGDGIKESKSVTAYSLEYSLSQKYLENLYNDGTTGSVQDGYIDSLPNGVLPENATYPVITLYNPDEKKLSLLHIILEKAYGWEIGYVDETIATKSRQFNIERESIYDFIMNEICEMFNCYATFTYGKVGEKNKINLYAESPTQRFKGDGKKNTFVLNPIFQNIDTVSDNGYKTTNYTYDSLTGILVLDKTPAVGNTVEVVGKDLTNYETDVFISFNNLSQEVTIDYNADDIKTVLNVKYGEDQNIREVNLGLPYITDLSYYHTPDWMGQELYDAYNQYNKYCESVKSEYTANVQKRLEWLSKLDYETNRVSTEYALVHNIDHTTVGTYYVRGGDAPNYHYIKKELPDDYVEGTNYFSGPSSDTTVGRVNLTEDNIINLENALRDYFTNKSMEELDGLIEEFQFTNKNSLPFGNKNGNSYTSGTLLFYLEQYKNLAVYNGTATDRDNKIKQFINEILDEFGLNMLNNLKEIYKKAQAGHLEGLTKANNANTENADKDIETEEIDVNNKDYPSYYPIVLILETIEEEIGHSTRSEYTSPPALTSTGRFAYISEEKPGIDFIAGEIDKLLQANITITESIVMESYFKKEYPDSYETLMAKISPFLREDELTLDDIVSTELDTIVESLDLKEDALSAGYIELKKLSQPQLSFKMSMANIYALPEFKPIIAKFQLGNLIKVEIRPGYIKQSRLMQVDMGLDDLSDFSCEFGELTNLRSQSDIHADLLSQAVSAGKQVANYSSYWTKGSDTATTTDLKIQNGLLDAVTAIKATDGIQDLSIDKYGLHGRKANPDNPSGYDDKQVWLVNNMLLFTDDNWKTSKTGIGEFTVDGKSFYGVISEAVLSGIVESSDIIGGNIRIGDLGDNTYAFQVEDNGNFNFGGSNGIVYNSSTQELTFGSGVSLKWDQVTDKDGVATTDDVTDAINNSGFLTDTSMSIKLKNYLSQDNIGTYITKDAIGTLGLAVGEQILMGDSATISWDKVTDKPTIPTLPKYITATKITHTTIESPSISGGSIIGGNIRIGDLGNNTYAFQVEENGNFNFGGSQGIVYNGATKKVTFGSNVSIAWGQIDDTDSVATKGYVDDAVDSIEGVELPAYITATKIDGNKVQSPAIEGFTITGNTIKGNTITGGSIEGSTIKTDQLHLYRNGYIYDKTDKIRYRFITTAEESDRDNIRIKIGRVTTNDNFSLYNSIDFVDDDINGRHIELRTKDVIIISSGMNASGDTYGNLACRYIYAEDNIAVGSKYVSLQDHTHPKLVNGSYEMVLASNFFRPASDNSITLGGKNYRFKLVYSVQGISNGSDMRIKNSFDLNMDKYVAMLDLLEPTTYIFNGDEEGSRHVGYIAQKVWKAMKDVGLEENDFGGFDRTMQEDGPVYTYGLRYAEFIPILHAKIKQLEQRIQELEAKLV